MALQTGQLGMPGQGAAQVVQHRFIEEENRPNAMHEAFLTGLLQLGEKVGQGMQQQAAEKAFIDGQKAAHNNDANAIADANPLLRPFMQGGYNDTQYRIAQANMQTTVTEAVANGRYDNSPEDFQKFLAAERAKVYQHINGLSPKLREQAVVSQMQMEGQLSINQAKERAKVALQRRGQAQTTATLAALADAATPAQLSVGEGDNTAAVGRIFNILQMPEDNPILANSVRQQVLTDIYARDYTEVGDAVLNMLDVDPKLALSSEARAAVASAQAASRKRTAIFRQSRAMEMYHAALDSVKRGDPFDHGTVAQVVKTFADADLTMTFNQVMPLYEHRAATGSTELMAQLAAAYETMNSNIIAATGETRTKAMNAWAVLKRQSLWDDPRGYVNAVATTAFGQGDIPTPFLAEVNSALQTLANTDIGSLDVMAPTSQFLGALIDYTRAAQGTNPGAVNKLLGAVDPSVQRILQEGIASVGTDLTGTLANMKAAQSVESKTAGGNAYGVPSIHANTVDKFLADQRGWNKYLNVFSPGITDPRPREDDTSVGVYSATFRKDLAVFSASTEAVGMSETGILNHVAGIVDGKTMTLRRGSEVYPVTAVVLEAGKFQDTRFYKAIQGATDDKGQPLLHSPTKEQVTAALEQLVDRSNGSVQTVLTIGADGNVRVGRLPEDGSVVEAAPITPQRIAETIRGEIDRRNKVITAAEDGTTVTTQDGKVQVQVNGVNTAGLDYVIAHRYKKGVVEQVFKNSDGKTIGIPTETGWVQVPVNKANVAKLTLGLDNTLRASTDYNYSVGIQNDQLSAGLAAARLVAGVPLEYTPEVIALLRTGDRNGALRRLDWPQDVKDAYRKYSQPAFAHPSKLKY